MRTKKHKASILVVALMILGIVLVTALSITIVSIKERKSSIGASKSTQAYQTAETGVEILTDAILKSCHAKINTLPTLVGAICDATGSITSSNYTVQLFDKDDAKILCTDASRNISDIASIKSVGTVPNQMQRAVETAIDGLADCTGTVTDTGLTYGLVLAEDCKCWLDRNLGAPIVPSAYDDIANYGWFFQWGRKADGHQIVTSATRQNITGINGEVASPNNVFFLLNSSNTYFNWNSTGENNLWLGGSTSNNPCPVGFRVPTQLEWSNLIDKLQQQYPGTLDGYNTKLKMTMSGYRDNAGTKQNVSIPNSNAAFWTSTDAGGGQSYDIEFFYNALPVKWTFNGGSASVYGRNNVERSKGASIRCIRN